MQSILSCCPQRGHVRFADDGNRALGQVVLIERANQGRATGRAPQDRRKWELKAAEAGGLLHRQGAPPVRAAATSAPSPAIAAAPAADMAELKVVRSSDASRHTVGGVYHLGGTVYAQDLTNK